MSGTKVTAASVQLAAGHPHRDLLHAMGMHLLNDLPSTKPSVLHARRRFVEALTNPSDWAVACRECATEYLLLGDPATANIFRRLADA